MSNGRPTDSTEKKRNLFVTHKSDRTERYSFNTNPPAPPIIAEKLLVGDRLSFLDFLGDERCQSYLNLLFGMRGTASATMLLDFYHAQRGLYFGHRRAKPGRPVPKNPGVLAIENSKSKAALKEFARRAYRGDPERRGQAFWKRVAGLIWQSYENFSALRTRSNDIKRREIERIARLGEKRNKGCCSRATTSARK